MTGDGASREGLVWGTWRFFLGSTQRLRLIRLEAELKESDWKGIWEGITMEVLKEIQLYVDL